MYKSLVVNMMVVVVAARVVNLPLVIRMVSILLMMVMIMVMVLVMVMVMVDRVVSVPGGKHASGEGR